MNPIAFVGLAVMLACYVLAAAKLAAWLLDRRDARLLQDLRADQMKAEGQVLLGKRRARAQPEIEPDSAISDPYCRAGWEDAA